MTVYHVKVDIEVIAESLTEAEDYVCDILDKASVYGIGLSYVTQQDREPGKDVTRIFDYDFAGEDNETD